MKAQPRTGTLVADVLEGEIRSKVGEGLEKTYTAGQMFLETPGQLHAGLVQCQRDQAGETAGCSCWPRRPPDHHAGVGNAAGVAPC